jgi:ABC-type phosphate transport system permease subunit
MDWNLVLLLVIIIAVVTAIYMNNYERNMSSYERDMGLRGALQK